MSEKNKLKGFFYGKYLNLFVKNLDEERQYIMKIPDPLALSELQPNEKGEDWWCVAPRMQKNVGEE